MNNADVIKMVNAGIETEIVLAAIKGDANRQYDTSADGLIALKTANVPAAVIAAMLTPTTPAAAPAPETAPAMAALKQGCYFERDGKLSRANALAAPLIRKSGRAEIPFAGIGGVPFYAWWQGPKAELTLSPGQKIVISGWDVRPEVARLNVKDGKRYATINKRGKLHDPEKVTSVTFARDEHDNYIATLPADLAAGEYWVFVDIQGKETPCWDFSVATK